MLRAFIFLAALCLGTSAGAQVAVVSAASYEPRVAANSIAAVFGTNLASAVAGATSLPLPTTLAGASVTVNGVAAPLFYASPTQVNFLVPAGVAPGPAAVVVRGPGGTQSTSVPVSLAAPAIFTVNSQGWGIPAAFWVLESSPTTLNSLVKADGSPVSVPGGAILVLFATGVRNAAAGSVTVMALAGGRGFSLAVQFAGAHPSLIGLDQINARLSEEINNLGNIDLFIGAGGARSNAVRLTSGAPVSAANPFVVRSPAGLRNLGMPLLAARANFAGALANYDALQCGSTLVVWDLDLLTAQTLPLPAGTCMLDAANGPGVLAASAKMFGRARPAATQDNALANQMAIADLPAGSLKLAPVNHYFTATPEQLGEMLVFPGQQRPRDLYADSINIVFTDAGTADSRPLGTQIAGERYWASFKPVVDPATRTAILAGDSTAAFVRLPSAAGAASEFIVKAVPLPAGASALAGLGMKMLPAAGKAVGVASGPGTGMALFYSPGGNTVASTPLPADVGFLCTAAGEGHGLEDLDVFVSSGGAAVSLFGSGCTRFLVADGGKQTVAPVAPAGIASLGYLHGLNNFAFAPGRTDLSGEFTRLVVLREGARLLEIVPPQATRLEPAGLLGYPVRGAANEVYVTGMLPNSRAALFVFRLEAASVSAIPAPEGIALSTFAWPGRRPDRVYAYGTAASLAPQLVTFDLAAGIASAFPLPNGTRSPTAYNPGNALLLFGHRDGVLAVRLE